MTALLLVLAGALLGGVIAWAVVSARCATHVLNLEVENALLQHRIEKLRSPERAS